MMVKFIKDAWMGLAILGAFVVVVLVLKRMADAEVQRIIAPENCYTMFLYRGRCINRAHRFEIRGGVPLCLCPDPSPASGKVTG